MRPSLFLALSALAACTDGTTLVNTGTLTLASPPDGFQLFSRDELHLLADASDSRGVKSLSLLLGERVVKTCPADPPAESLTCETSIAPADVAAQVKDGQLLVHARLVNGDDGETDRVANVVVDTLVVNFLEPGAQVKGSAPLKLSAKSEVPVRSVVVTYDAGLPLRQWDGEPYEASFSWAALVGLGKHALVATVTDSAARTATARLEVDVLCAGDGDCDPGKTCCTAGDCAGACR